MKQARQHEFDMMKGVAIFMVVMGHIMYFGIGTTEPLLFRIIGEIHMPLFFFISGWFTMKIKEGIIQSPNLWLRFKQLVVPMVVVSTIWFFYPHEGVYENFPNTLLKMWMLPMKAGYWFTITLFGIIVVYKMTVPVLRKANTLKMEIIIALGIWLVLFSAMMMLKRFGAYIYIFNLDSITLYWSCFVFGVLTKKHSTGFLRLVASDNIQTVVIIIGVLAMSYMLNEVEFTPNWRPAIIIFPIIIPIIMRICLGIFAMRIFTS